VTKRQKNIKINLREGTFFSISFLDTIPCIFIFIGFKTLKIKKNLLKFCNITYIGHRPKEWGISCLTLLYVLVKVLR